MPVYQLSLDNLAAVMIWSLALTMPFLLTHPLLVLATDMGNLDSLDEGVEFGYRVNDNEWIHLA